MSIRVPVRAIAANAQGQDRTGVGIGVGAARGRHTRTPAQGGTKGSNRDFCIDSQGASHDT